MSTITSLDLHSPDDLDLLTLDADVTDVWITSTLRHIETGVYLGGIGVHRLAGRGDAGDEYRSAT